MSKAKREVSRVLPRGFGFRGLRVKGGSRLSFPTKPVQTLSTVPNQGCCSQVWESLFSEWGESSPAPNVPAFVRPQGDMQLPGLPDEGAIKTGMSSAAVRSGWVHHLFLTIRLGRESEVLGMNTFLHELVAWANQASVEFGKEIAQAARWPTQMHGMLCQERSKPEG